MNNIVKSSGDIGSSLRLWAFILFGGAFGATYGMLTMSTEITSGCFQQPAPFCGMFGSFLNLPAVFIVSTFISDESLYWPMITLMGVLIVDMLIGGCLGIIAAKKFKENAAAKFGVVLLAMTLVFFLAFILFFISSGP
jgi:uncharacterized membrane protein YsdA (DUF1294 family)